MLVRALDPPGEIAARDRRRRGADRLERAQSEPDDPEAQRGERREHGDRHEELDQQQPPERPVDVRERGRDDDDVSCLAAGGDADAIAALTVLRSDGEEVSGLGPGSCWRVDDVGEPRRRR